MYITLTLANSIEVRDVSTGLNMLFEEHVTVSFVKFCIFCHIMCWGKRALNVQGG